MRNMTRHVLAAALLLPAAVVSVSAQAALPPHRVSVTLSPFHLVNPELHLTGEMRLAPKIGVAGTLGAGRITDEGTTSSIWETAGQFRYYFLGSFARGLMLGADAGHVDLDTRIENPIEYLAGSRAGGFLGYKFSTKRGFTAEVQLGPVYLWGDSAETSEWQTLENLKIGWSF